MKRFKLEPTQRKQNFLGENPKSSLILLTDESFPRFEVVFGGNDAFRDPLIIDAEEFIGVKSFKAKGKRISTYTVETINELEPLRKEIPQPEVPEAELPDDTDTVTGSQSEGNSDILDEITGQMKLF